MRNQPECADGAGRAIGQDERDDKAEARRVVIEPLPPWEAQPLEATRIVINLSGREFEGYQVEGRLRGRVEVELRDWDADLHEPEELELVGGRAVFVCREAYEPLTQLGDPATADFRSSGPDG